MSRYLGQCRLAQPARNDMVTTDGFPPIPSSTNTTLAAVSRIFLTNKRRRFGNSPHLFSIQGGYRVRSRDARFVQSGFPPGPGGERSMFHSLYRIVYQR